MEQAQHQDLGAKAVGQSVGRRLRHRREGGDNEADGQEPLLKN
jgi:hypothetical protein